MKPVSIIFREARTLSDQSDILRRYTKENNAILRNSEPVVAQLLNTVELCGIRKSGHEPFHVRVSVQKKHSHYSPGVYPVSVCIKKVIEQAFISGTYEEADRTEIIFRNCDHRWLEIDESGDIETSVAFLHEEVFLHNLSVADNRFRGVLNGICIPDEF